MSKISPFPLMTHGVPAERDNDPLTETTTSREVLMDTGFVQLVKETVTLPGGEPARRYMLPHKGAAAMLALDGEGNLVFERQWRHPCKQAFWEIPAGKIDDDEAPLTAAKRELQEECGIVAKTWHELGTVRNAIGYSDERIVIFVAEDLTWGEQDLDPGEYLEVVRVPFKEALRMAHEGLITDCKTLVGLMWLERFLAKRGE